MENPFLMVQILKSNQSDYPHNKIFDLVSEGFRNNKEGMFEVFDDADPPFIQMDYYNSAIFEKGFSREVKILENLYNFISNQLEDEEKQQFLPPSEYVTQPVLILKYITNYKKPILDNYRLGERVAQLLHFESWVEEIEQGFFHFFGSMTDFEIWFGDKGDFKNIIQWVKSKHIKLPQKLMDQLKSMF